MKLKKIQINILIILISSILLNSCKNGKLPGADARKISPDPRERVAKNLEEGRGFRLSNFGKTKGGTFDFASSNELWRASLDILDFMPLALANYSGGIIVTDWYSDGSSDNESVKISIRFLSNEIRSDALSIKVFYKNCSMSNDWKVSDRSNELASELSSKILVQAAIYEKQQVGKKEPYIRSDPEKQ